MAVVDGASEYMRRGYPTNGGLLAVLTQEMHDALVEAAKERAGGYASLSVSAELDVASVAGNVRTMVNALAPSNGVMIMSAVQPPRMDRPNVSIDAYVQR